MEKERTNKITDSEWQIMEQVWAFCEESTEQTVTGEEALRKASQKAAGQSGTAASVGITQPYLMEQLDAKWNKNTVHTFLKRLCDKGYLQAVKDTSPHQYVPLISREACEREERQSFLDRVYQGSAGRMVTAFVRDGGLKEEEVAELRKLLEQL